MAARQHSEKSNPANNIEPIRHPATAQITAADCYAAADAAESASRAAAGPVDANAMRERAEALRQVIVDLPILNASDAGAKLSAVGHFAMKMAAEKDAETRGEICLSIDTLSASVMEYIESVTPAIDGLTRRRVYDGEGGKIETPTNAAAASGQPRARKPNGDTPLAAEDFAMPKITAAYCHAQKSRLLKAVHPFRTEDEGLDYRDQANALDDLIEALPICNSRDADAHIGLLENAVENLFRANNESDRQAAHVRGLTLVAKLGDYLDRLDPAVDDIPLRRVWDEYGNKREPKNAELWAMKAETE